MYVATADTSQTHVEPERGYDRRRSSGSTTRAILHAKDRVSPAAVLNLVNLLLLQVLLPRCTYLPSLVTRALDHFRVS